MDSSLKQCVEVLPYFPTQQQQHVSFRVALVLLSRSREVRGRNNPACLVEQREGRKQKSRLDYVLHKLVHKLERPHSEDMLQLLVYQT